MELSPKQQINELVKKSEKILLISHASLNGDALGGMLALGQVLTREGKDVTIVSSEKIADTLTFLPGTQLVKSDISGTRDLIVQIDKTQTPIEKLCYNAEDNFLNIIITPKDGQILPSAVKLIQGEYKFDLIFVLDTPDVDKIDSVYDRHTELFFETPIVNVDHHVGNEYFGTVNMVDLTATSTCEILVSVIESMGANYFDEDVATCLLSGIISDTGSFKNTNTTPKSMTISAQMLAAGARQQEIIQHFYKTRSIDTLKLWGKVLSRLDFDRDHRFIYSFVTYDDFADTGAKIEDIRNVMDELLSSTPGADVVLLLAEHEPTKIAGKLKGIHGQDVLAIAEIFGGTGKAQSAGFDLTNVSLDEAIPNVLEKVRRFRSAQLGRDKIEHVEKKIELDIPLEEKKTETFSGNHLPEPASVEANPDFASLSVKVPKDESEKLPGRTPGMTQASDDDILATEIEKLDVKIEENSQPEEVELSTVEIKKETEELFNKFITAGTVPDGAIPEEPEPVADPIIQALESLEHEDHDELRAGIEIEKTKSDERLIPTDENNYFDQSSSGNSKIDTPNIDIPKTKEDSLRAIGEIMRGYNPTEGLDKKEEPKT